MFIPLCCIVSCLTPYDIQHRSQRPGFMAPQDIGIEYLYESAPGAGYEQIMVIIDIENFANTGTAHANFLRDAIPMTTASAIEFADHQFLHAEAARFS